MNFNFQISPINVSLTQITVLATMEENSPMSKSKLKKLKRDQEWEANRAWRKARRKEKMKEKKLRKRTAKEEAAAVKASALDENDPTVNVVPAKEKHISDFIQLPITIVLDCGFDDFMTEKEKKSLAAQITRCYSDNHKAPFRAHLVISSFGGDLKQRFDQVLSGNYLSWKDVRFLEEDFVHAADRANGWMEGKRGGKLAGALQPRDRPEQSHSTESLPVGETIYLTSDSPNILTELKPYSTYIVGGIVDRNRHKGICYKRAMDRGITTAKLPISDYMEMTSRFVLATNHVSEIMVRWLELGDWGEAFMRVMPKRKGGVLKTRVKEDDEKKEALAITDVDQDRETEWLAGGGTDEEKEKEDSKAIQSRSEHGGTNDAIPQVSHEKLSDEDSEVSVQFTRVSNNEAEPKRASIQPQNI